MRVFHRAVTKKKDQNIIVTSKRPIRSLRGAAHRTQHDTSLPKHYKNVNGQPTARGAARNRVAKCTWCTAIKGRARQQKVLTSSMRLQGPGQCQRLRRRAPWDVPRGQQRWFHAVPAFPRPKRRETSGWGKEPWMNRVFSINQGYKVKKRACAARQGDSVPLRVLTNEPVTCRRALWATRQALGDDGPSWLQLV